MHLLCTNGSPVVHQLAHLPPIPLIIDYQYANTTVSTSESWGIFQALQMRDRVRRVILHMPTSNLEDLLVIMDEPFPILEQLTISSTTEGMSPKLPETFLAPNLRHLTLSGITLPGELTLLSTSVVTLTLTNIQATSYFLPRHLVTHLRSFSRLEGLTIGFSIPLPRPSSESELSDTLESPVTLPTLRRFMFNGVTAYLESLVSQIRAPLLENLSIALFNQIAFALPHLSDFVNATPALKLPMAKVIFKHDGISVISKHPTQGVGDRHSGFIIRVICGLFDWQIDTAGQICRSLTPVLSCVEEITLDFDGEEMPTEWQNGAVDDAAWHDLLRPFIGTKRLHICHVLQPEISRALQVDDAGLDPGLLPSLQELILDISERHTDNSFTSFVDARQVAGHPVRLVLLPELPRASPHPTATLAPTHSPKGFSPFSPKGRYPVNNPGKPISYISPYSPWVFPPLPRGDVMPYTQPTPLNHNRPPPHIPLWVEQNLPCTSRATHLRGIQPPVPIHFRSRYRPSHKGAVSAPWR